MSPELAISVRGVAKAYPVFSRPVDRLRQLFAGGKRRYYRDYWALRDIDLEIGRGETVGIIGANGSGKSTLLQLICGNLAPTSGTVQVNGRVAALLELGAGFNPEFTGRENVELSATILGIPIEPGRNRFGQIISFADIGDFIDQPIKTYSSGMYARLAFSVAIHCDPDILLVDEALSVGDEAFQRKCYARIEELRDSDGTILFVSHSSTAVVDLCDRAVLLHRGHRLYTGQPKRTVGLYQKLVYSAADRQDRIVDEIVAEDQHGGSEPASTRSGNHSDDAGNVREPGAESFTASFDPALVSKSAVVYPANGAAIEEPRIVTDQGIPANCLVSGQRYRFGYRVLFHRNCEQVRFYNTLKTVTGVELGGGAYPRLDEPGISAQEGQILEPEFEFSCNLNPGTYFFNCGVSGDEGRVLHRIIDALPFRVLAKRTAWSFGLVDFQYSPSLSQPGHRDE